MKLNTTFMGLPLRNPLIVGSSTLTGTVKNVKKCEKKGAGAVVLKSLYEEQITADPDHLIQQEEMYQWYPEAIQHINDISKTGGKEDYLQFIRNCKKEVGIPVIASINCITHEDWPKYAYDIENAGADALELNISIFPKDDAIDSETIESQYLKIVQAVIKNCKLPISIKLSPYFTNIRRMSSLLCHEGVQGLILFNRFYRPDIDIFKLKMIASDALSGAEEMTQSLRWVGLLSRNLNCDLVASTGVHDYKGAIKMILAGASAVQLCSVLYKQGMGYMKEITDGLMSYMHYMNYNSLLDFKGEINRDPYNTATWERIHFMKKTSGQMVSPIQTDDAD
ncbi:MAG TPA: hypothetical protein DDY13_14845 [Cytophagales bacterium]|jgi:dihydroorotate dehydrogenase (fumarate)|nr:hypothetical protein [Cytophagales bacterium]